MQAKTSVSDRAYAPTDRSVDLLDHPAPLIRAMAELSIRLRQNAELLVSGTWDDAASVGLRRLERLHTCVQLLEEYVADVEDQLVGRAKELRS